MEESHVQAGRKKKTNHKHGVGFLVHKEVARTVVSCSPISGKTDLHLPRCQTPQYIPSIQVYIQTSVHDDVELEEFY